MTTRAVRKPVEPKMAETCAGCARPVTWSSRGRRFKVVANVYVEGRWDRVEHFHDACYAEAGEPYGAAA